MLHLPLTPRHLEPGDQIVCVSPRFGGRGEWGASPVGDDGLRRIVYCAGAFTTAIVINPFEIFTAAGWVRDDSEDDFEAFPQSLAFVDSRGSTCIFVARRFSNEAWKRDWRIANRQVTQEQRTL